jgi:hypothetical protein
MLALIGVQDGHPPGAPGQCNWQELTGGTLQLPMYSFCHGTAVHQVHTPRRWTLETWHSKPLVFCSDRVVMF